MSTLSIEQKRLVEQAGDRPVRLDDPETGGSYVLLRSDVFERLRSQVESEGIDPSFFEIDDYEPARETARLSTPRWPWA